MLRTYLWNMSRWLLSCRWWKFYSKHGVFGSVYDWVFDTLFSNLQCKIGLMSYNSCTIPSAMYQMCWHCYRMFFSWRQWVSHSGMHKDSRHSQRVLDQYRSRRWSGPLMRPLHSFAILLHLFDRVNVFGSVVLLYVSKCVTSLAGGDSSGTTLCSCGWWLIRLYHFVFVTFMGLHLYSCLTI